jgi:hypothetical protein
MTSNQRDPEIFDNPDTWAFLEDPERHVFCVSNSTTITGWV